MRGGRLGNPREVFMPRLYCAGSLFFQAISRQPYREAPDASLTLRYQLTRSLPLISPFGLPPAVSRAAALAAWGCSLHQTFDFPTSQGATALVLQRHSAAVFAMPAARSAHEEVAASPRPRPSGVGRLQHQRASASCRTGKVECVGGEPTGASAENRTHSVAGTLAPAATAVPCRVCDACRAKRA
jgi:hypothetical protein